MQEEKGRKTLQDGKQPSLDCKMIVTVPEKHFCLWLKEQSKTIRRKMLFDFIKDMSLYVAAMLIFLWTNRVYRELPIALLPILTWIFHSVKKRLD